MECDIKSKILGKTLTFFRCNASHYIFVNLNGQVGTLGLQICKGGKLTGSTLSYVGEDEAEFKRLCQNWYRTYLRNEGETK